MLLLLLPLLLLLRASPSKEPLKRQMDPKQAGGARGKESPWATDKPGDGVPQLQAAAQAGIHPAPPGVPTTKITTLGMAPYYYDNVGKKVSGAGWV